ncbi:hypothetical protein EON66_10355 [archaeon]|nr:MAG: hypothetical protein EON66_10355 [archaeon]
MVDVALIVIAAIVPFVLTLFNVIVMSRYLDLQATSGHYFAKLMIVRRTKGCALLTRPLCAVPLPVLVTVCMRVRVRVRACGLSRTISPWDARACVCPHPTRAVTRHAAV